MNANVKMRAARSAKAFAVCASLLGLTGLLCAADWQVEYVDPGGGGKWSTLLIDSNGNGHVSYGNEALHELHYGYWDHKLRKWFTMLVDDHSGGFISMALDSQQRPHISYLNYGPPRIKYAHWDGSWKVEEVATGSTLMEYYTSIAIDADDQPVISYYEILRPGTLDYVLHLRTIRRQNNVWQVHRVDATPGSGKFNSLASNRNGRVGIAYANVKEEHASLRFAWWNGAAWRREILLGAGGPHHVFSVAAVLGDDGAPHISFTDLDQRTIRYATFRAGQWQIEDVGFFAREAFPDRNGITVDEQGNPYMTFIDAGAGALKLGYRVGGRWRTEVVDGSASGFTSSIQVKNGEIVITYYDAVSNSLKCFRRPAGNSGARPEGTSQVLAGSAAAAKESHE